jgi:hypothetical protein
MCDLRLRLMQLGAKRRDFTPFSDMARNSLYKYLAITKGEDS